MRGKLEYRVEGETNLRITPADAGKTETVNGNPDFK